MIICDVSPAGLLHDDPHHAGAAVLVRVVRVQRVGGALRRAAGARARRLPPQQVHRHRVRHAREYRPLSLHTAT